MLAGLLSDPAQLVKRYNLAKRTWPGRLFLIQVGDSLYAFGDDARIIAQVCGSDLLVERMFAGAPAPTVALRTDDYEWCIARLREAGHLIGFINRRTKSTPAPDRAPSASETAAADEATFVCPECGHRTVFDPWSESARCPRCGFTPPVGRQMGSYLYKKGMHPLLPDKLALRGYGFRTLDAIMPSDRTPERHVKHFEDYRLVRPSPRPATSGEVTRVKPMHLLPREGLRIVAGEEAPPVGRQGKDEVVVTKCPQCGGALHYEPGASEVTCPYCSYQLDLREEGEFDERASLLADLQFQRRHGYRIWKEARRVVRCQSCGAELSMTSHLANRCAFCGSTDVLVVDNERPFERPDGLLPFRIGQEEAAEAVRQSQHSILQRLRRWWSSREYRIQELQGLYLPFWAFDGTVEIGGVYRAKPSPTAGDLDRRTFTHVEYETHLDNLLIPAVDAPEPSLLERVHPFDMSGLIPYEEVLIADWPARLYNLDVEMVVDDVHDAMITLARQRRGGGPRTGSLDPHHFTRVSPLVQVSGTTYQLILLPVWVAVLETRDERGLVLVNGQTGKVCARFKGG